MSDDSTPSATPPERSSAESPPKRLSFRFTGQARDYFRIWVVNMFLSLATLGLWSPWAKVRKQRSLIPYAEPFGFAAREVDGNDALDVYHSARWARATALSGQPVFLDCITFRLGLYSSHFGEVRQGIEADLAEAERRDPLNRMTEWLIEHGAMSAQDLLKLRQEEEQRIEETFAQVAGEMK